MLLIDLRWDLDEVVSHSTASVACCLALQGRDVRSEDGFGEVYVLSCHWTITHIVHLYQFLQICCRWRPYRMVEVTRLFRSCELPCREGLFVLFDGLNSRPKSIAHCLVCLFVVTPVLVTRLIQVRSPIIGRKAYLALFGMHV